jgi:hypothetical protein
MKKKEKLHIAKEAYKAVKAAIDEVESYLDADIYVDFPLYIEVDGMRFDKEELEK